MWLLAFVPSLALASSMLVYSRTAGYRHDSIPVAIDAIRTLSAATSPPFLATFSEDERLFTDQQLAQFDVIAFLSNSDQVLTSDGELALQRWLAGGPTKRKVGFVGLHAATACLFEDVSFAVGMGALFSYHPAIQNTYTKLVQHPTTDALPARYATYEEVYHFRTDPRTSNVTVLLTADPTTYSDPMRGMDAGYYEGTGVVASVWSRDSAEVGGTDLLNGTQAQRLEMNGRTWMTSLGHTNETWRSPVHLAHVQSGFQWVIDGLKSTSNSSIATITSATSPGAPSRAPTTTSPSVSLGITTATSLGPSTATAATKASSAEVLTRSVSSLLLCLLVVVTMM